MTTTLAASTLPTPLSLPAQDVQGFDPVALRKKYDQERDRRLRSDGNQRNETRAASSGDARKLASTRGHGYG